MHGLSIESPRQGIANSRVGIVEVLPVCLASKDEVMPAVVVALDIQVPAKALASTRVKAQLSGESRPGPVIFILEIDLADSSCGNIFPASDQLHRESTTLDKSDLYFHALASERCADLRKSGKDLTSFTSRTDRPFDSVNVLLRHEPIFSNMCLHRK